MSAPPPQPETNPLCRRYAREGLSLWRLGLARLLPRWWQILLIVGIGAALVLCDAGGWDNQLLQQIRQPENEQLTRAAKAFSFWGDIIWAVALALVLFAQGVVFGCPRWRQTAWACLLAVLASTILVNVFRLSFGRARPDSELPDGFHGPHLRHAYHSFPSGHATSAFAPAAAVAAAAPLIGVPCLLFAGSVGWSRMQLNDHHPLDVLTGAALGTLIGLCFGSAVPGAKFRIQRKKRRS